MRHFSIISHPATERAVFLLFAAGTVVLPLFFYPSSPDDPFLMPKGVLLSVITIFILMSGSIPPPSLSRDQSLVLLASALFIALISLSIPGSTNYHKGLDELNRWVLLLALLITASFVSWTPRRLRTIMKISMAAGTAVSISVLLEYFEILPFFHYPFSKSRLYSFFGHHNILAHYLTFVFLWGTALAADSRSLPEKTICFVSLALTGSALLLTFSRASILAAALGLIVFFALSQHDKRDLFTKIRPFLRLALMLALVVLALHILTAKWDKFSVQVLNMFERADSLRLTIWKDTARMILNNPLRGIGLGNYPLVYPLYKSGDWTWLNIHAYNELLYVTAETGIAGLTGLVVLTCTFLVIILRKRMIPDGPEKGPLPTGILSGVTAACFGSMLSYNMHDATSSYFFFLSLGILCSGAGNEGPGQRRGNYAVTSLWLVIVATISLWTISAGFGKIMGNHYYNKALVLFREGNSSVGIENSLLALHYQPHNNKYHQLIGSKYAEQGLSGLAEKHLEEARKLSPYVHGRGSSLPKTDQN